MFVAERAAEALAIKSEAFHRAATDSARLREQYEQALDSLSRLSSHEVTQRLGGVPWPGAYPGPELDSRGLVVRFPQTFATAEEARHWALDRLAGVPTAAVDGSQAQAAKEFGVPVSLAQVAWFVNEHDPDRPYTKDVRNEVIVPENEVDATFADALLSRERFRMEMEAGAERIGVLAERRDAVPVLFTDGTFVLSFAGRLAPEARDFHLDALFSLLDASEQLRIPAIGYVDLSFASDLVTLLSEVFDLPVGPIFDAQILSRFMGPLDRTALFRCARGDILPHYRRPDVDRSEDLYFTYLKVGHDRVPSRVDLPRWVVEDGLVDRVLDTIRAEIIVGSGYPYPLETADATAVLTAEDRMAFYRLYQAFARDAGFGGAVPLKSVSKAHRR